ncbi:DUF4393 domain-containing protein [Limosilactobacillus fermentum]|uniref:DUF4393 domain-containing protein n=1 Tax=Limosilactobacillus fermentum TaxID=1613 RepID=UPI00177D33D3|nr:DUF4393 domain-containing protein [Limosilactobacillus fermentum]MBD5808950.1 hypothetical protein [Limosilactobacillus fermentum]
MDPNQIEAWKNFLPQSTIEYLVNPSARTTGQALDGVATALCWPLLKLRIIQKAKLEQFTKEIREKNKQIPVENRDSSKVGLAVKAIEEARYQLNEDDIRKLYVNLIASTVDNRKNNVVSPRLATVVAQFGPSEAKFLKTIYQQSGQQLPYGQLRLDLGNGYGYTFPAKIAINDNSNIVNSFNSSLDILVSLGVVNDKSKKLAKSDDKYSTIEKILRITINMAKELESKELNLVHSYINLTDFGHDLCKCIFE